MRDEKVYDQEKKQYNHGVITPKFLRENDGKLVWIRDDYLLCMGYVYNTDRPLYDFLDHVERVKKQARESGITFSA